MRSETEDQKKRPSRLKMLMNPTKPAAAPGVTRPEKVSWIIGDAWASTPMPAVTLRKRTAQRSQNCGVLSASSAVTFAVGTSFFGAPGTYPAGTYPGGGTRTVNTPNIMK